MDNALFYNFDHAEKYDAFLRAGIYALATKYADGRTLGGFPELHYMTLKRRRWGHGHYVIYEIDLDDMIVSILHVFHTRMDVQGRLTDDSH